MELAGRVVVVTGAGSGIGRALAVRFAAEGAAGVVCADRDLPGLERTVALIGEAGGRAIAARCDVAVEAEVAGLVVTAETAYGPVDLFCSNAGVGGGGGPEAPDALWQQLWEINLMAHVYAVRAVLPSMLARGEGYLLHTASAAGLLTNPGNAPYTVTKAGAVAFAEWVSMTYGDQGIRVSCLCPQGVRTPMLVGGLDMEDSGARAVLAAGGMIEVDDVADAVIAGLATERFLILPHPEVADFIVRKATDRDRWLAGMRRLVARMPGGAGQT